MIIGNSKKYRDDLVAISNYIEEFKGNIDMFDLIRFIATYEYYNVFYQNYLIIKDLIKYKNENLDKPKSNNEYSNEQNLDDLLRF